MKRFLLPLLAAAIASAPGARAATPETARDSILVGPGINQSVDPGAAFDSFMQLEQMHARWQRPLFAIPEPQARRQPADSLLHPNPQAAPEPGVIASWRHGMIAGGIVRNDLPGMAAIATGRLGFTAVGGPVTATAFGEVQQIAFFRGYERTLGFGGSLSVRLNDRVSLTAFGNYYSPLRIMAAPGAPGLRPELAGYLNQTNYGGYADINLSEHWGLMVGAKATRRVGGQTDVAPIATPYYKINGRAAIAVPVGEILYEALRSNRGWGQRNPTIGPQHTPPPVR